MSVQIFVEELRRARTDAGLSQDQLGEAISYSPSLIGMVETGRRTPSRDFASRCDTALGTAGLLSRLLDHILRLEATPLWFRPWLEIEAQATALRSYGHLIVPGLLQTEEYARAILPDEEQVSTRMRRQAVLDRVDSFIAVIDEVALIRPVAPDAVMAGQTQRLLADERAVVHVVPAETRYYAGLAGPFTIAVVDGAEMAVMEAQLQDRVVDLPEHVAAIRRVWEGVLSEALPRRQSRTTLEEAHRQWTSN